MPDSDFLLPVSFKLAAEIGLEECVLLTFLRQRAFLVGAQWMTLTQRDMENTLPFWNMPLIMRLLASLQASHLVEFRRGENSIDVRLQEAASQTEAPAPTTSSQSFAQAPRPAASSEDALAKVSRLQRSAQQVPSGERVATPQRERSKPSYQLPHSDIAPRAPAVQSERRGVSDFDRYLEEKERTRQPDQWQPEESTYELIGQAGIERQFAKQLLPEFLLRIKELRKNVRTWNSEFLKYVKRQWQYQQSDRSNYESASTYSNAPKSNREAVRDAIRNIHDTDW